jgi:hypothetical protein
MGLLDFIFSAESQIQRHQRRLLNRDSQPEDRDASARWLSEKGTPTTLMALLQRFDVSLEHQLKDAGEKEFVYSLVASHGQKAIEPVKAWLRQCKQFAMPLRLLAELSGQDSAVEMAFELLDIEHKKDDFKPEKKRGVLTWLAEVRHPGVIPAVKPFLADFDDGVRFAAVQVLANQPGDAARPLLEAALANPKEESNRLQVRICEIFQSKGWPADASVAARMPGGFKWADGRIHRG